MAFSGSRLVASAAAKLLGQSRQGFTALTGVSRSLLTFSAVEGRSLRSACFSRSFTRSMWVLCSKRPDTGLLNGGVVKLTDVNKTCSCCGLHTHGDKELANFLAKEIETEKDNLQEAPKLKDFEISTKGTEVTLTRNFDGEIVTIDFNVNLSVDDESMDEEGEQPQMVSRPRFTVELKKSGGTSLSLNCSFTGDEGTAEGEEEVDVFQIDEVTLHEGEEDWQESSYIAGADNMDGTLYDLLMTTLEERGVDNNFAAKLVTLSTSHEHRQYIKFLEDLKSFVSK
ncbi:PREDICTED: complement component 1 Q subcomponent-binding protein, mitochondrial-like [Branchiostoma belcheri]|uniref:Complement component 1 Q subcomponent-binding protein, mitochondrial n=1 Tax=Branchiostoma belcheri TaxID=7741 RepID=A0A6P4Y540_BRABE|nr:PREDICTED: complement component 1 Q subcomponent-binding protein, mitochondrial-like [Branchiostoma belcheri]